jgi:PAS domain S-box-containing protein
MADYSAWLIVAIQFIVLSVFLFRAYRQRRVLREVHKRWAESEARFRMLFENSGVGMALFTPQRQFLEVNPALVRLLGYSAEELCGKRLADFLHQDDSGGGLSHSEQGLDEPTDLYEREKRFRHKAGHKIWARVVWVPVRTSVGRLCNLVGVLIDITERRVAEQALAASEGIFPSFAST